MRSSQTQCSLLCPGHTLRQFATLDYFKLGEDCQKILQLMNGLEGEERKRKGETLDPDVGGVGG